MVAKLGINKESLYEEDYLKWIETTVDKLRLQDFSSVDWENLIEEIESLGKSEQKSFKSNLIVVLIHLLKWQFQRELRSGSWAGSIVEHRRRIEEDMEDSPSLKPYLEEVLDKCYLAAVKQASAETGLALTVFPQLCPYTSTEVLDSNFMPDC
jgi:hypothetical protein